MKDIEPEEPDIIMKLKNLELDEEEVDAEEDPSIEDFRTSLKLGILEYKKHLFKVSEIRTKMLMYSKQNEDLIEILKRVDGVPGSEKIHEGVHEYLESFNIERTKEEYKESRIKVSQYLDCFRTLREIDRFLCFVCLEATCDVFLDPCGHSVCSGCVSKLLHRCPFCRGNVIAKPIHWAC